MLAYTVGPAVQMILGFSDELDPFGIIINHNADGIDELWRQTFYISGFLFGYIIIRGKVKIPEKILIKIDLIFQRKILHFLVGILFFIAAFSWFASGPINNYYDVYTRYDNLGWLFKKIISGLIRIKYGIYTIVTALFFLQRKSISALIFILIICSFEAVYSYGSRIQIYIILMQALCLYNFIIKPIPIIRVVLFLVSLSLLFSIFELVRLYNLNDQGFFNLITDYHIKLPGELLSVFSPAVLLYGDRISNLMPIIDWPFYFYGLISLFTFGDDGQYSPMEWFRSNYTPNLEIPPWTLGPIAESAIWGGLPELMVLSVINGIFFAFIVKLFIKYSNNFTVVSIYAFIYGSCILTIKYSIFYVVNPILKNVLPVLIIMYIYKVLIFKKI